jgi:hypothetical protein
VICRIQFLTTVELVEFCNKACIADYLVSVVEEGRLIVGIFRMPKEEWFGLVSDYPRIIE